jgi:hypothetical protein
MAVLIAAISYALSFSNRGSNSENARPNIGDGPFLVPGWVNRDSLKLGALNIYSGELASGTISSHSATYHERIS